ncbi:MocR-like pyridoxine biosynthesis transcription factor PdxR [Paenibacillus sp. FJAT-27812]|uniref:MocR-like pyridoxine biosynthesis transcription factor PdxR n=1 Tax=Paenibacillus sp. FJAT-27812 TaxID=1684143 RepID=UPI0006A7ED6C|nr:PLP-dependent aminotransferase family protein [Paenibacillus sp. FJAT-27812]
MWFSIDRQATAPMFRQVFNALQAAILTGQLQAGYKLPSTRELAEQLNVSRNVILEAYDLLLAEGYINGRSGAGTYVAEGACLIGYTSAETDDESSASSAVLKEPEQPFLSFRTGLPALELFPMKQWGSILQRVCMDLSTAELAYGDPSGNFELRQLLAQHLRRTRGVISKPEHIIITNGAVQALQLIVRLLLQSGDVVLAEDPSNDDLKSILTSTGAVLQDIPVDDSGLQSQKLPQDVSPKCIYVTPSHQFPLGGILPIQRRIELVEYARRTGSFILEDDYDSEFRYDGAPVHSLQHLCPEQVIYIGTFSKIMFPSLRVGYMIVPECLVDRCRQLKKLSDYQTPSIEQLALVRFMAKGYLNAHILKMKKLYKRRREQLLSALHEHLDVEFRVLGKAAGLHLVVEFSDPLPVGFSDRLKEEAVHAVRLPENRLLLGYGHLDEQQIYEGACRIGKAMKS